MRPAQPHPLPGSKQNPFVGAEARVSALGKTLGHRLTVLPYTGVSLPAQKPVELRSRLFSGYAPQSGLEFGAGRDILQQPIKELLICRELNLHILLVLRRREDVERTGLRARIGDVASRGAVRGFNLPARGRTIPNSGFLSQAMFLSIAKAYRCSLPSFGALTKQEKLLCWGLGSRGRWKIRRTRKRTKWEAPLRRADAQTDTRRIASV